VVREGNPSHRPVKAGVTMPAPAAMAEPDWAELFPELEVPAKPRRPPRKTTSPEDLASWAYDMQEWRRNALAAEGSDRSRARAAAEWVRIVPLLTKTAGLADVDRSVVVDYCVTVARLEECERRISIEGLVVMGQRGECRNPLTTVASQYRTQLKAYIGELGLSPSSRGRLTPPGDDDDGDDAFD
jgi:P27 family predicted phage terminase small subunit